MDTESLLMIRAVERMLIELGGTLALFLGALLFRWGFVAPSDLEARQGEAGLTLRNAAPGTLFALFGIVVLLVGLLMPMDLTTGQAQTTGPTQTTGQKSPDDQKQPGDQKQPTVPAIKAVYGDDAKQMESFLFELTQLPAALEGRSSDEMLKAIQEKADRANELLNPPTKGEP